MQRTVKGDAVDVRATGGAPLTPLELNAWRGLLRAHADMVKALDADLRSGHGLTLSAYEVLMLLGTSEGERLRISELSAGTLLSVSGISRMVDRLEREGLVVREACEQDGRGAEAVLTPAGRVRLDLARASHLEGVRRGFLARFSDEELDAMGAFWERIDAGGTGA